MRWSFDDVDSRIRRVLGGAPLGAFFVNQILHGRPRRWASRRVKRSVAGSIYRGRLLALSFEPGTRDTSGDVEKPEALRLLFKTEEAVDVIG